MRWLIAAVTVFAVTTLTGCEVKVQEPVQPTPVIRPERKIDINVDGPRGVDVKIKKD